MKPNDEVEINEDKLKMWDFFWCYFSIIFSIFSAGENHNGQKKDCSTNLNNCERASLFFLLLFDFSGRYSVIV